MLIIVVFVTIFVQSCVVIGLPVNEKIVCTETYVYKYSMMIIVRRWGSNNFLPCYLINGQVQAQAIIKLQSICTAVCVNWYCIVVIFKQASRQKTIMLMVNKKKWISMFLTSSEEFSLVRSSPQSDAPYTK